MGEMQGLYESDRQLPAGAVCAIDGCKSGSRAAFVSERFQRGLIALTNTAGVLSLAQGNMITLFQYGREEDASGAGFPASSKFRDADTNVSKDNGLHDVVVYSAGIEFGEPHYITGSGDTFVVADGDEIAGYRDAILRNLSENLSVLAIHCPDENNITHTLGNPGRNPSMRGFKDQTFPTGNGAVPGVPLLLQRAIDIPAAEGNKRPFSVTVTAARAMSWAARSTVVTANVYVPITVTFEVKPRG